LVQWDRPASTHGARVSSYRIEVTNTGSSAVANLALSSDDARVTLTATLPTLSAVSAYLREKVFASNVMGESFGISVRLRAVHRDARAAGRAARRRARTRGGKRHQLVLQPARSSALRGAPALSWTERPVPRRVGHDAGIGIGMAFNSNGGAALGSAVVCARRSSTQCSRQPDLLRARDAAQLARAPGRGDALGRAHAQGGRADRLAYWATRPRSRQMPACSAASERQPRRFAAPRKLPRAGPVQDGAHRIRRNRLVHRAGAHEPAQRWNGLVRAALGTPNPTRTEAAITSLSELVPVPDLLVDDSGRSTRDQAAAASATTTTSATEPFQQQHLLLGAAAALVSSDERRCRASRWPSFGLALDTTQCGLCPMQAALSLTPRFDGSDLQALLRAAVLSGTTRSDRCLRLRSLGRQLSFRGLGNVPAIDRSHQPSRRRRLRLGRHDHRRQPTAALTCCARPTALWDATAVELKAAIEAHPAYTTVTVAPVVSTSSTISSWTVGRARCCTRRCRTCSATLALSRTLKKNSLASPRARPTTRVLLTALGFGATLATTPASVTTPFQVPFQSARRSTRCDHARAQELQVDFAGAPDFNGGRAVSRDTTALFNSARYTSQVVAHAGAASATQQFIMQGRPLDGPRQFFFLSAYNADKGYGLSVAASPASQLA
jgi:hypothetical protein